MRAYSAAHEEARQARDLLKEWAGEGFITTAQYQQMEQETVCNLRRTNIFLRIVLFVFTLIVVGAAIGLFFTVFLSRSGMQTAVGIFLMAFAAVSYAVTELAVSRFRLYRHGIEEALAVCSVGFLCVGMYLALFSLQPHSPTASLIPTVGAIAALWIWYRFGLAYASLAAMVFVLWLPGYWTSSHAVQHVIIAALYALGLIAVVAVRPRHRLTYLNTTYSIAEGLLWLGIYLAINLQLSSVNLAGHWLKEGLGGTPITTEFAEFPRPFYWTTWVLTWCLPPVILLRGLRLKDRFVIAAGAIAACLTLVTNKPYLGWERHTWDPMIFGVVLIVVALFIRRWLARGPDEIRHGFTARRL